MADDPPEVAGYLAFANRNCAGNDLKAIWADSPEDCSLRCNAMPECEAIVFYYFRANPPWFCYLKRQCLEEHLYWDGSLDVYMKLG